MRCHARWVVETALLSLLVSLPLVVLPHLLRTVTGSTRKESRLAPRRADAPCVSLRARPKA
jgi:hypothetical protein